MGSTVSESDSRRITMGMLVTGSIIRPRIFISTSIVVPPWIVQSYARCGGSASGLAAGRAKILMKESNEQIAISSLGPDNVWTSGYGFTAKRRETIYPGK